MVGLDITYSVANAQGRPQTIMSWRSWIGNRKTGDSSSGQCPRHARHSLFSRLRPRPATNEAWLVVVAPRTNYVGYTFRKLDIETQVYIAVVRGDLPTEQGRDPEGPGLCAKRKREVRNPSGCPNRHNRSPGTTPPSGQA